MCFLQGPEGELQSSPSWPLHHFSDTDRLQHPHSLSPPRQHLSTPRLAFPQLSILPNLIFLHSSPLLSLLFSCPLLSVCCRALCVLPCISQVLIKSLTSGAWIMFRLCFFFHLLSIQPIFYSSISSSWPCHSSSCHLLLCKRDVSTHSAV